MENNNQGMELEDKLLNNSSLFFSIRKTQTTEDKIKKVNKYLDRGADVNATDANDKNNTPLHVAVMKEEPEVVSLLLERGALVSNINSDNQTALDIARRSDKSTCRRKCIVTILEAFDNKTLKSSSSAQDLKTNLTRKSHLKSSKIIKDPEYLQPDASGIENQTQSEDVNNDSSVRNRSLDQYKPKQQECNVKKTKGSKIFHYQKRSGTSGLSGQLYETKLLSLILFRALYVQEVKTFLIATNVENMGAFDDIIFRFYTNKDDKPKIMFVQAKHRDNPAKDKFTVEEIMKVNGDFSLHKYLESYIKISQMFVPENNDEMFRGEFKNMDCEFIIYTSAFEKFSKIKSIEQTECQRFINTSKGKVFQFDYDDQDVELLVQTVAKSRAVLLAKRLSKFIFKDNHSNMMMDDLIKTYHVFLARQILAVEVKDGESQNNFSYAKFRESFFSSNDNLIIAFKATICNEVLLLKKNICPEKLDELESFLMSLTFKVPVNFGNLNFCFSGSEQKKEKKLEYLSSIFKKLFENAIVSANIVMKVDDNMVGPNEILQSTDLESYRLGSLVGNLLVFDNETKTLKFNSDVKSLSNDNRKLLEKLESHVFKEKKDLSKCRFDINVPRFPRLSLDPMEYDKSLIEKFLSKLIFYTNQATEGEVEGILKDEIDKYFVRSIPRESDAHLRVNEDAIFLKVHDRVQKWWKQSNTAPYLTEACEYFYEAEQDVLNSPLLSILNLTYTKTIKNTLAALKFKDTALERHLDGFFTGTEKILSIITEENTLSSIKLIQYFKERNFNDYSFIDLDYVKVGNYFVDVKSEIKASKINTLIFVCKSQDVVAEIVSLIKYFEGKIIIISVRGLANPINELPIEEIVERVDSQTGFKNLADTTRTMLLDETYIVFQGKEVPLGIIFENESFHLINSKVLNMIINNEKITIGNFLNNKAYDETLDVYIKEHLSRYITLDPNVQAIDGINVLKYNELGDNFTPDSKGDTVLITDKAEEFTDFIHMHNNCNVHWFSGDKCLVWKQSRGNLLNIMKHVHRRSHDAYTLQPVTLKDVSEKVVIISAEPGMGKSFLLTHLAINTKDKYPALWISKINLLECTRELRRMKENKVNIDLKEAVQFLFRVIGFEASEIEESKPDFEIIIDLLSVIDDDILFNKNEVELNITGLNLLEIDLFIHCYNNDRVVLLFDGFDEICPDFVNEFLQLVNIFKKSKIVHLWITSRLYNVLHHLESTLETFSFTIKPWPHGKQEKFLRKMLSRNFSPIKLNIEVSLKGYVELFHYLLKTAVEDQPSEFLSIPLHLYIMSDFFKDYFRGYSIITDDNLNLGKMYERFVYKKFINIRFGEKKPRLCFDDPDMRKMIDNERIAFLYVHKMIAAHLIFGKTDEHKMLFDDHDIKAIQDFIEGIKVGKEKTGIIEQIIQNKPKFVHYTFAEYFATEFLCDKLKLFNCRSSLRIYIINLFLQPEYGGLERFFNAKLKNHQLMFNEIYNADLNEFLETLLLEHQKLSNSLLKAIVMRLDDIAIILFKFVKAVLNNRNLNDFINVLTGSYNSECIVCTAVRHSTKNVLTVIFELIKDIDVTRVIDLFNCSDLPDFNPLTEPAGLRRSLCRDVELLDILLSDLTPAELVDLFCRQIIFIDCQNNEPRKLSRMIHCFIWSWWEIGSEWFDKTLETFNQEQLMTIFSARDSEERVAAHIAALKQAFRFFEKLESLLERRQFMLLCMTLDESGRTPIDYFRFTEQNRDKLEILFNIVNEGNIEVKKKGKKK